MQVQCENFNVHVDLHYQVHIYAGSKPNFFLFKGDTYKLQITFLLQYDFIEIKHNSCGLEE
jgi:hypothetical protein